MGKKINFDVFALITPLEKPVTLELREPKADRLATEAYLLALAIKRNQFVLPQVLLLGEQVTKGPSPVRYLQFDRYEAPDYAIKKIISELSDEDRRAIQSYLWSEEQLRYDTKRRTWLTIDTPFTLETERAFNHLYGLLSQLDVLRPRQRMVLENGKHGMP